MEFCQAKITPDFKLRNTIVEEFAIHTGKEGELSTTTSWQKNRHALSHLQMNSLEAHNTATRWIGHRDNHVPRSQTKLFIRHSPAKGGLVNFHGGWILNLQGRGGYQRLSKVC